MQHKNKKKFCDYDHHDIAFHTYIVNINFIKISSKFIPKGPTDNIPALVQIMAWRRPGNKPLSEPMMV